VFGKESRIKFIGWWVSFAFLCKVGLFYSYKLIPMAKRVTRKEELILGRSERFHKSPYKKCNLDFTKGAEVFCGKNRVYHYLQ